jgi:hypothetical protein
MFAGAIDIHHVIKKMKNRVQPTGTNRPQQPRQESLHRQMLIMMAASIIIFFATTLPVSIRRIMAAYELSIGKSTDLTTIVRDTGILTVLLTLNYAVSHSFI